MIMTDSLLEKTQDIGDYRIKIYYDTDAECPLTNWDMCGRYLFEYSDSYFHRLHKECDWSDFFSDNNHSLEEALHYMVSEVVVQKDIITYLKRESIAGVRLIYNKSSRLWELQIECRNNVTDKLYWSTEYEFTPYDLKHYDYSAELTEYLEKDDLIALIRDCAKDLVIKEWSSTGYSQGDYVEGIAFCTKERYAKMVNTDTTDWKNKIDSLIDEEVKNISMWMWGDVKGFVLEKKVPFTKHFHDEGREDEEDFEWEEIDSCWGYYMGTEELINEVITEHGLKEAE